MLKIVREGRAKKEGAILMAPYARVSTDKDDQQNSLASQRDFFSREIKETPGLELYDEYYDGSDKIGLNQQSPYSKGGALI